MSDATTLDAEELDCPCGARTYKQVLKGSYTRLGYDGYPFRILECLSCGLARTDPVPDVHSYETDEYHEGETFATGEEDLWSAAIAAFVASRTSPGKVLNVGAHTGNLHPPLEKHGYEVLGIDIDPHAIAAAQAAGRNVIKGDLLQRSFDEASFDVITIIHTLEHLEDPDACVAEMYRVLKPGGHLFINVPNRAGVLPKLMKEDWIGWVPPFHVWQFTPKTLEALVQRASGFQTVFLRGVGSMEPPSTGMKGKVKKIVATTADKAGFGDQVVSMFRKPA